MPYRFADRFSRVTSLLESLRRGRDRRRRKLTATLSPAMESLESRTLLTLLIEGVPYIDAVPGAEKGLDGSGVHFEAGEDVRIHWFPAAGTKDTDIRIYHVDTGQEVVNENHLTADEFIPSELVAAGRYQVFLRARGEDGQAGGWQSPRYFNLTAGVGELPKGIAQFTGLTDDESPALTWTPPVYHLNSTFEVVVYNVDAGVEVFRQTGIEGTSLPVESLLNSGNEYQAFVRSVSVFNPLDLGSNPNIHTVHIDGEGFFSISDWSDAFHFQGEGESQIPSAAVHDSATKTVEWGSISGATRYDVVIYNTWTGQEVDNLTGITEQSIDLNQYPVAVPQAATYELADYQMFYRARYADDTVGLWSEAVTFQPSILIIPVITAL